MHINFGHIGCELAVLAALCVLSIFLFPSAQGPYSAVHGPVTALQAVRGAARLRSAILAAGRKAFSNFVVPPLRMLSPVLVCPLQFEFTPEGALSTILRC